MGKKVLFLDSVEKGDGSYNVTYGTDDINAIVRSLTGAGVSIFPSGETFNVSDLNSITEAMVSEGVSFDGLRVSLSDGKIHIAPGVGFFENGAIITVDADGAELEYKVSENVYVYAEYDKTLNICDFHTSEEAPSDVEDVFRLMLAVIEADGTVNDRRSMAVSKVGSIGKNLTREVVVLEELDSGYKQYAVDDIVYEFSEISEDELIKYNMIQITADLRFISDLDKREIKLTDLLSAEGNSILLGSDSTSSSAYIYAIAIRFTNGKLQLYVPNKNTSKKKTRLEMYSCFVEFF